MIRVELEFMSIDQAIVALGKLVGAAPSQGAVDANAAAPANSRKGRADKGKARGHLVKESNAGTAAQPAGEVTAQAAIASQAPAGAPEITGTGKAAVEAANPIPTSSGPVPAVVPAPPLFPAMAPVDPAAVVKAQIIAQQAANSVLPSKPATAVVPTPDEVQAAMEKLFNAKGMETARAVLSRFGAKRVRDLKEDQRAQFIVDAEKVTAGGQA